MDKFRKTPTRGGTLARVSGWFAFLPRAAGTRLFRADDERASRYGWQVTARHGGLARTYRDPRFGRRDAGRDR